MYPDSSWHPGRMSGLFDGYQYGVSRELEKYLLHPKLQQTHMIKFVS